MSQSLKHFSLKPLKSARPRESQTTHKGTLVPNQQPPSVLRLILPGVSSLEKAKNGLPISILRLCFLVVVPPFFSILFAVEKRGYYFSICSFLNFSFSVLKIEAHERLLTVFFIHAQRESKGMSPVFLGYLHFTHSSLLPPNFFCQEAKK